jgi:hypothetical protein
LFLELNREGLALDDLAGLDAAGADADALGGALDDSLDRLQVHVPATPGGVVGVRYIVAELRTLAAKITFLSHDLLQSFVAELPCGVPSGLGFGTASIGATLQVPGCGSGRHERIRTADLYRVKVAL